MVRERSSNSSASSSKKQNYELYLKINANRAADLIINDDNTSKKSVNPVLTAVLNDYKKSTSKKQHTTQPSWDDLLTIPLNLHDYSQILVLTVWDKHKRYKNYMGELRLRVSDIFFSDSKFVSKTELKWYKLYANKDNQCFVTGSLLLSFELTVKTRVSYLKWKRARSRSIEVIMPQNIEHSLSSNSVNCNNNNLDSDDVDTDNVVPVVNIQPPSRENTDDLESTNSDVESVISEDVSKSAILNEWILSLLYPTLDDNDPDEQGFYDGNELYDPSDMDDDMPIKKNGLNLSLNLNKYASSMSDSSVSEANYSDSNSTVSTKSKLNIFKKSKSKLSDKFEFRHRKVLGVLFIEIVSCLDLPPLRNVTKTSYDVDPFVVVTFGKKTFRTSWKRHDLNPIFNERLAFEVLEHERDFDIQFNVLDKDIFSNHDKVATVTIPLTDITSLDFDKSTDMVSELEDGISMMTTDDNISNAESEPPSSTSSFNVNHEDNIVKSVRRGKFTRRKKITSEYVDTSEFKTMSLPLKMFKEKYETSHNPELKIRVRFETYSTLRRNFWEILLTQSNFNENDDVFDSLELSSLLDTLGCTYSESLVELFYRDTNKLKLEDVLTKEEISILLEQHIAQKPASDEKIFEFEKCPICLSKRLSGKQDVDIITHVAICASKDWSIVNKMVLSSFISPQLASRKWLPKLLKKITYGGYKFGGSNSANILVQDRVTGIILEEKMSVYVRLGIRILYNGLDKAKTKRIRKLLKQLSIRQGTKFDDPQLKNDIKSFVKFHGLDLSDCLEPDPTKYATFNEFFYRKLNTNARPVEALKEKRIAVSPADCRCTAFDSVNDATELWIKGRNFTIAKLFNGNFNGYENTNLYKAEKCSVAIFRLAPQDYHRFHCPVDGVIGEMKFIEGEYYTVNPMAIRSKLDVFGENVRAIIPIETENFGTVIMVAVGAMMVGSTVLTVENGQSVKRGEEVGYFKFGGSTIILLFENEKFKLDSDLINNSKTKVETLIRVGQSIGHLVEIPELERKRIDFSKQSSDFKRNLIRILTGGDIGVSSKLSDWESNNIKVNNGDLEDIISEIDDEDIDEGDSDFDEEGLIDS